MLIVMRTTVGIVCVLCVASWGAVDAAQVRLPGQMQQGGAGRGRPPSPASVPAEPQPPAVLVLHTGLGDIEVELLTEEAPVTVKKFIAAVKAGLLDGKRFYQVFPKRMIAGGDDRPRNQVEKRVAVDFEPGGEFDTQPAGRKGGSQWSPVLALDKTEDGKSVLTKFFICLQPRSELNDDYAVIGRIKSGADVAEKISIQKSKGEAAAIPFEPVEEIVIDYAEVK